MCMVGQGAMPLGNGGLTVLCWPNISSGGVGFYIGHQNAMDSHTALIRLGEVQVRHKFIARVLKLHHACTMSYVTFTV